MLSSVPLSNAVGLVKQTPAYLACRRNRHKIVRHGLLSLAMIVFFADFIATFIPWLAILAHTFIKPFAVPIAAFAGHLGFSLKPED